MKSFHKCSIVSAIKANLHPKFFSGLSRTSEHLKFNTLANQEKSLLSEMTSSNLSFLERPEVLMKMVASLMYAKELKRLQKLRNPWQSLLGYRLNGDKKSSAFTFVTKEGELLDEIEILPFSPLALDPTKQTYQYNFLALTRSKDMSEALKIGGEMNQYDDGTSTLKFNINNKEIEVVTELTTIHDNGGIIETHLHLLNSISKKFYIKCAFKTPSTPIDDQQDYDTFFKSSTNSSKTVSSNLPNIPGKVISAIVYKNDPNTNNEGELHIESKMNGKVVKICNCTGQRVKKGDSLIVIEAMKLESVIRSPISGIIASLSCREGEYVKVNQALMSLTESLDDELAKK